MVCPDNMPGYIVLVDGWFLVPEYFIKGTFPLLRVTISHAVAHKTYHHKPIKYEPAG